MRFVTCVILPVGLRVQLRADTGESLQAAIAESLAASSGIHADQLEVLDQSRFGTSRAANGIDDQPLFVLVRVRAGGKGGFRKQLEKKGREFARAKAKEDRAKRITTKSETPKGVPSKTVVESTSEAAHEPTVDDIAGMRTLVAQGVEAALKRSLSNQTPAPRK